VSWYRKLGCIYGRHNFLLTGIVMHGRQVDGPLVIPAGATVEVGVVFSSPVRQERCANCGRVRETRANDPETWAIINSCLK